MIVWLDNCPPLDGHDEKRRPLIVVVPELSGGEPAEALAVGVACSASYGADERDGIALPNHSTEPQTTTGLTKPCWAIPRWFLVVRHDTINASDFCGTLGGAKLQAVLAAYVARRLSAAD